jgi:2-amino-4-hydroxy-6-hydroxymethyldihydropteridine diphosphokinase
VTRAVLSIGSNVGDCRAHLQLVVDALGPRLLSASALYATAPWGGVEQQDFLNAVLIASDPEWDCWRWLAFAHECEEAAERVRGERWGPRTLDVDIVSCQDARGEVRSEHPDLVLPHPRAKERAFVLVPWLEADPAARLDGSSLAELLERLPAAERDGVRATGQQLAAQA